MTRNISEEMLEFLKQGRATERSKVARVEGLYLRFPLKQTTNAFSCLMPVMKDEMLPGLTGMEKAPYKEVAHNGAPAPVLR